MTTYDHFVGLPIQLKLEIIKKCYPIPYVRLRRSYRFLDEICEKNRRRLGIFPYQRCPELYLLNSFNPSLSQPITFTISETTKQKVIDTPHIVINYGRFNGIPGFLAPMTKENIPQIRRSLSGFAFTRVTIKNWTANRIKKPQFGEAVVHFLEVAGEHHIQYLGISGVTASEVETIVTTWKTVKSAYFNCSAECWDVIKLDCIKNIKQLLFTFGQRSSQPIICERTIQELALDREVVRFFATDLDRSVTRPALESIVASWKDGIFPGTFCYAFSDPRGYYDETNIYNEWNRLMPTNALYLGNYIEQAQNKNAPQQIVSASIQPIKFDIWINERPDDNIFQLFYITRRIYEETWCETDYHLLTRKSKDELIILLIEYIFDHVYVYCPLDYSGLYEEMCSVDSLTGNRGTFSRLLDTFYKKINRRTRCRQPPKRH